MSNLLQTGIKAHQRGDFETAKQCYQQQLNANPQDYQALQLLGLALSAQGDMQSAVNLMQQSLQINGNQPHVLQNLGVILKRGGQFDGAEQCFKQAIRLKADYLDPIKSLVSLHIDKDEVELAKQTLEDAIAKWPEEASLLSQKAYLLQHMKHYDEAVELYRVLLDKQPDSVEICHNLGLTLRLSGKPADAMTYYNRLLQKGVTHFQLYHNVANALSDQGKLQEAITFYRHATQANPGYVESHVNLNELLWELENNDEFLKSYEEAFAKVPYNAELKFSYVRTLLRLSNYQVCEEFLNNLPEQFRQSADYYDVLAESLKGQGKMEEALAAQKTGYAFPQSSSEFALGYAKNLLEAGKPDAAEEILQKVIDAEPENVGAWALIGISWRLQGNEQESVLNDYDNLVRAYTIEIPDGYESVEAFCKDLEDYLISLHTSTRQPLEQTLMGGTQTRGNLFDDKHPLIKTLVNQLSQCVRHYIEDTQAHMGALPVIRNSEDFGFSGSWSVRLSGKGYHTPHVHPMGWLSSAFYVQLPDCVEDESAKQGWFKLGEPNLQLLEPMEAKKFVKPAVGKLVLFQSYMWHGTVPFETDETRTTVAFDIARVEG